MLLSSGSEVETYACAELVISVFKIFRIIQIDADIHVLIAQSKAPVVEGVPCIADFDADTVLEVTEIDPQGNTPEGPLERAILYNGVFWMVWSHWFPETKLLS